jgi:hypothetical protein
VTLPEGAAWHVLEQGSSLTGAWEVLAITSSPSLWGSTVGLTIIPN